MRRITASTIARENPNFPRQENLVQLLPTPQKKFRSFSPTFCRPTDFEFPDRLIRLPDAHSTKQRETPRPSTSTGSVLDLWIRSEWVFRWGRGLTHELLPSALRPWTAKVSHVPHRRLSAASTGGHRDDVSCRQLHSSPRALRAPVNSQMHSASYPPWDIKQLISPHSNGVTILQTERNPPTILHKQMHVYINPNSRRTSRMKDELQHE